MLMAHEASPGHRPEEWWIYEKNPDPPECSEQAGMLMRMGELAEHELDILMRKWREVYNKANEPYFSYCIGSKPGTTYAHWLKGEAARWPRPIVEDRVGTTEMPANPPKRGPAQN